MPPEIFLHITEWLSVRDVLALRMTCKGVARLTLDSKVWSSFLKRLSVILPILPATQRNFFGCVSAQTYEWLVTRGIYLSENWDRRLPRTSLRYLETFSTIIEMKFLPGGQYLVTVIKGPQDIGYTLVLWDLDYRGSQTPLAKLDSPEPFMNLDVKYGFIDESTSVLIAFSTPPVKTLIGVSSNIRVFALPLPLMEEVVANECTLETLKADRVHCRAIFSGKVPSKVSQLSLGDFGDKLGLAVLCRPHSLFFFYVREEKFSSIILDTIPPHLDEDETGTVIFQIKLLPYQNCVLVARVYSENTNPTHNLYFCLELCDVPALGVHQKRPKPRGVQYVLRLRVDGFHFSDLEESWFSALRNPRGLLHAPETDEPPSISIFVTTYNPRGLLHLYLRPVNVPGDGTVIQYGDTRRVIPKFEYQLPALCVKRQTWKDPFSCPKILPGAFRSIIWMRPHIKPEQEHLGKGMGVLRVLTYKTVVWDYGGYATSRTTGTVVTEEGWPEGPMEIEEEVGGMNENIDPNRSLRIPSIPGVIAKDMVEGTTSIAFDESTGKMCVANSLDTRARLLDFGAVEA